MIAAAFRLGLHAAEPHANPAIEAIERSATLHKASHKVSSGTPNLSVEVLHLFDIEVVLPAREFPHLILKFLHGLGPHATGTAGEDEP